MTDWKSVIKPILPVFIINWIFGLGVIQYPLGNSHPIKSFIYSSFSTMTYLILASIAYFTMPSMFPIPSITVPLKILFFSQILLTISSIILGFYHNRKIYGCITRAVLIDTLLEEIGIQKNYTKMLLAQLGKFLAYLILTLSAMLIVSLSILSARVSTTIKVIWAIVMNYPILLLFIADLPFTTIVSCVKYRFVELNELLKSILTSSNDTPQHRRVSTIVVSEEKSKKLVTFTIDVEPKNYVNTIRRAKRIHLQLIEVCREMDNMYGMQILVSIAVAFTVITGNVYLIYVMLIEINVPHKIIYKSLTAAIIWIAYHSFKIRCFSSVCSSCIEQSIKTGDIINEFYDDPTIDSDVQTEIRNFNIQMIQRPLTFSAFGFINLDFTLIQGMIASITTYLMILIQLRKNPSIPDIPHNSAKTL